MIYLCMICCLNHIFKSNRIILNIVHISKLCIFWCRELKHYSIIYHNQANLALVSAQNPAFENLWFRFPSVIEKIYVPVLMHIYNRMVLITHVCIRNKPNTPFIATTCHSWRQCAYILYQSGCHSSHMFKIYKAKS